MKLLCMIAVFLCIPWVASDAQKQDWGNLKRYAEANKELVRKGKQKDGWQMMPLSLKKMAMWAVV